MSVSIVFHQRPYNTAALNVLLGALETRAGAPQIDRPANWTIELRFARGRAALAQVLAEESAQRERVLVAWSFYSPEFAAAARDLAWLRRRVDRAGITHIAGGAHASAEPRATLAAGFDLVAQGEGEATIRALASALEEGSELARVRGVAQLSDGALAANGQGERVELDDFPPFAPAHARFNAIEITRGCIYACGFCQTPFLFKARFRHRSVANVRHWTDVMRAAGCAYVRSLSPTSFSYGSQDESLNLDALEELLASVRESLGASAKIYFGTFPSEVRPEHVTPEVLALVRKHASNTELVIGGQSGSDRVLAAAHRGHTSEDVRRAVRVALAEGFLPNVDFLFGLPGERAEDVAASLRLARELADLGARIHAHSFMPLPGTPLKDARAGALDARTVLALEQLASRGAAWGQWRAQLAIARRLARARRRDRAPSR